MAKRVGVVESISKMIELLEGLKSDADKFEGEKAVNAAGGRVRKGLQEVKKAVKPIRDLITVIKKERTKKAKKK